MARIIVIDDEQSVREMIAAILESSGHWVRTATDGREGILQLNTTPADLIITDLVMPEMDGMEVITRMRSAAGPIPVIAISGNSSNEHFLHMARLLGAQLTLAKPFHREELLNAVDVLLKPVAPA